MNTLKSIAWVILLSLTNCAGNTQYRTSFVATFPPGVGAADVADHRAILESCADYTLGYVEFDDQGWFWDAHQRDYVEAMVREAAGLPTHVVATAATSPACTAPTKLSAGIVLVTFVHGWKENASYDGDGAASFREILLKLNEFEQQQAMVLGGHPARRVIGVYAGWRGLSAAWEPFKELSIFDRKEVAHKVGGYGAMTRLFTDLENIQQDSLDSLEPTAPRTELIIIGHSLGAGAVYSALSQIVTERFASSIQRGDSRVNGKPQIRRLKPLGDQIILINPAFEASRHFDLYQMANAITQFQEDQRPVLSIFTSESDWATHYVFPLSRWVGTLFDSIRPSEKGIDQKSANLDTVGWYEPFITHELEYRKDITYSTTQPAKFDVKTQLQNPTAQESISHVRTEKGNWKKHDSLEKFKFDHAVLKPTHYTAGNPFLIVKVDEQIMNGHNDYANPVFVNFIREYIEFCSVPTKDRTK